MLYLAFELSYFTEEEYSILLKLSKEISKIISGLIKTLN